MDARPFLTVNINDEEEYGCSQQFKISTTKEERQKGEGLYVYAYHSVMIIFLLIIGGRW